LIPILRRFRIKDATGKQLNIQPCSIILHL
jgi:hypothetical protein